MMVMCLGVMMMVIGTVILLYARGRDVTRRRCDCTGMRGDIGGVVGM